MSIPLRERERRCIFRNCDTDTSDPVRWRYLTLATKKQLSRARQEFDVHDDVDSSPDDAVLFICRPHDKMLDKIMFQNGACRIMGIFETPVVFPNSKSNLRNFEKHLAIAICAPVPGFSE
jgi:hypothetical protein